MNRRSHSRKKDKTSSQNFPQRIVYFNQYQKLSEKCRICSLPQNLISVCDCNLKYHENCLLNYIRLQMKKSLVTQMSFNPSNIRCPASHCQKQIHFSHDQRYRYDCKHYLQKVKEQICEKYMVLLFTLFVILAAFAFVAFYLSNKLQQRDSFILFCVFCLMCLTVGVSMVGVCIVCFTKYIQIKQIYLKSIIPPKIQRYSEGAASSSSDENGICQNISDYFEIYIGS